MLRFWRFGWSGPLRLAVTRLAREDSRAALQAQLRVFDPAGKGTVSTEQFAACSSMTTTVGSLPVSVSVGMQHAAAAEAANGQAR
jgi:hypothetical protein